VPQKRKKKVPKGETSGGTRGKVTLQGGGGGETGEGNVYEGPKRKKRIAGVAR